MKVENNCNKCIISIPNFNITPNILIDLNTPENSMLDYYFKDLNKNINKQDKLYKTIDNYI